MEGSADGLHVLAPINDLISEVSVNYRLLLNRKCIQGRLVGPGRLRIICDGSIPCLRLSVSRAELQRALRKFMFSWFVVVFGHLKVSSGEKRHRKAQNFTRFLYTLCTSGH